MLNKPPCCLSKRPSLYEYKYYQYHLSQKCITYTCTGNSNFYIIIYTENNKNKLSPSILTINLKEFLKSAQSSLCDIRNKSFKITNLFTN